MADNRMQTKIGWLVVATLVLPPLFWAGNFIVGRAIRDDISPVALSFLRSVVAFALLAPFAWPHVRAQVSWYRAHWVRVLLIGLCGVTAFNTLVYYGLHFTTATNGALLNSTTPLWILVLGALFLGRRIRAGQIVGLFVSLVGVGFVVLHGEPSRLMEMAFSPGDLIILVAVLGWGIYTLGLSTIPPEVNRLGLLLIHLGVAIVTLTPLLFLTADGDIFPEFTTTTVAAIFYIGMIASLLSLILFMKAVMLAGPTLAGQIVHLMPFFAAMLGALFLGEELHLYHATGFALILLGVFIVGRSGRNA